MKQLCSKCKGTCLASVTTEHLLCVACDGQKQIDAMQCTVCHGIGTLPKSTYLYCSECNGKGTV